MNEDIKALEKELADKKRAALYEKWENYLTKLKAQLELLKGKTILAWSQNGVFTMFQVSNIKEQYYIDREGFNGQWSPKRWLEIETDGHFLCRVADDKGRWFHPGVQQVGSYHSFRVATKTKSRDKTMATIDISKMVFHEESLNDSVSAELASIYKVGFTEYKEYSEDPSYTRALDFLTMFAHVVPNELYDAAKAIHERHLQDTINFWKQFEPAVKDAPRVYNTVDLSAK